MDITRDAKAEFDARIKEFKDLVMDLEGQVEDCFGMSSNQPSWEDVRVVGDFIEMLEAVCDHIANT